MIHVLATIELHPGCRASFLHEFARVVPLVREEPGCLEYGAATDLESGLAAQAPLRSDTVVIVEKWSGLEALTVHAAAPHMAAYRQRVAPFVRTVTLQVLQPETPGGAARMRPIGVVRSPYAASADVPKGLGARHDAEGTLEVLPEYEAGLLDIDGFSHLFVLWLFDRAGGCDLVGAPPTDDRPHGVFATRSPRRPNPLGLTVVQLLGREGARLRVRGLDMLDGTPILDIKPYLSSVPADQLRRGWLAEAEARRGAGGDPPVAQTPGGPSS